MNRSALVMSALTLVSVVAHAAVEDDLRDGDAYFDDQQYAKAAAAYDRAIQKAPGQVSAEAYGKRAAIFTILGDVKGGLAFVEKAELRLPGSIELLEQKAVMLWESDRHDDAIAVAEKVVAARPQAYSNQALLGEYYATRDPAKAITAYESYLANRRADLEKGDVLPRVRLGVAYLATARTALDSVDSARARELYTKAAQQFELVERRHGKQANAQVNADNGLCAAYAGLERWDQAISRCEKVTADAKHVDRNGSAWFNLGTAYLARKQPKKARGAATEFTKLRKTEARGFMLVGDTYFAERDWPHALAAYLEAAKLAVPAPIQIQLSIRLGKTYRRMPGDDDKNVLLAIDKLAPAQASTPPNTPAGIELAIELGDAYLAAKQELKAAQLADKVLTEKLVVGDERATLLSIAGKGRFAQRQLADARQRFEAARQLKPGDLAVRRDLVATIDEQAFDALAKDPKDAAALLDQALAIDPDSPGTLENLAILAIDRGDCDVAVHHLTHLERVPGADPVLRPRLLGRALLCQGKPDAVAATAAYAAADKAARAANAPALVAEIDTEWAPLLWDTDLAGAVDKLEAAVKVAGSDAEIGPAAKRNLALALYRRGWKSMQAGKAMDAAVDFDRAGKDATLLRGTEPLAFEFSHALALLDAGRGADAGRLFKALAAKGNQGSYLRAPFAKLGGQLFAAYASYRAGTPQGHQEAANDLGKLMGDASASGAFGDKLRELVAASWEAVAFDQWRAGQGRAAATALATAARSATGDTARRIDLDRAALALDKSKLGLLEGYNGAPAEALVNLGIVYDLLGRPRDAYDAWVKARARGVQARDLTRWIDAKKRIFGYP